MHGNAFTKKLAILSTLSAADLRAIERLEVDLLKIGRRRPIITEGDLPDYIYVLLAGWAARYELRSDGSRRITGFLIPGDFCGIHAVCHAAMDHSIIALTKCEIGCIPIDAVADVIRHHPAINLALWRAKLIEEAILRKWLLFSTNARATVAHLLCELYVRAAIIGLADNGRCEVPLTQEEVGDALGLTAVHVNRVLRRLPESGSVELAHQELLIKDAKRLTHEARFDRAYLEPWLSENDVSALVDSLTVPLNHAASVTSK